MIPWGFRAFATTMATYRVKFIKVFLVVLWFIAIIFCYYLYKYPQELPEIRKMQGVITDISPTELTIDITRTQFLLHPHHPELEFHTFKLDDKTVFRFDAYVYKDDMIVATRGTPLINRTEVFRGDSVFVHYNTSTGIVEHVLVATPILWY